MEHIQETGVVACTAQMIDRVISSRALINAVDIQARNNLCKRTNELWPAAMEIDTLNILYATES